MALFMIFYKAKHTQLGGQITDMPNYIYRFYLKPFNHLVTLFLREGILHFAF